MIPTSAEVDEVPSGSTPIPAAPATVQETGLSAGQISQLIVKSLYSGEATGLGLAQRIRLPYGVLEPLMEAARLERLIEVHGASGAGTAGYRYMLTDGGRDRAQQYFEANTYVGPAPIPIADYIEYMAALDAARGYVDRSRIAEGFSHLVVETSLFEQLGPAINANKAIFLYGPPGNGKSVLGEGMGRALGGDIYVPYALDVDGQVVTVYDPVNHEVVENEFTDAGGARSVLSTTPIDRRWVRIRRPVVVVGGELTLSMLDLSFNSIAKFYEAPLQLKANGGVFLVDDFGRQRMRPEDLLNRWIVPLESRVDYLTLHTGKKFRIPFDVLVVFATNLDPMSLADEAFLRRIPYKIPIEDPTVEQFSRIFELNCRRRNLKFHQVMVAYLHRRHYRPHNRPMRACHPRDLIDQITALCRFRGEEPTITRELLDAACEAYFLDETLTSGQKTRGPLDIQ
jgi:hypothetical protein